MKYFLLIVFLGIGVIANAQKVESNGTIYKVKGDKIFKNGEDVTDLLTEAEKLQINTSLKEKLKKVQELEKSKKTKKDNEKADKSLKKAEKKQKGAEKELKKNQKIQDNYEKAERKYQKEQKK